MDVFKIDYQFILGITMGIFISVLAYLIFMFITTSIATQLMFYIFKAIIPKQAAVKSEITKLPKRFYILDFITICIIASAIYLFYKSDIDFWDKVACIVFMVSTFIGIFIIFSKVPVKHKFYKPSFRFVSLLYVIPFVYVLYATTTTSFSKLVINNGVESLENAPDLKTLAVFIAGLGFTLLITLLTSKDVD